MPAFISKLNPWRKTARLAAGALPYRVECSCGQVIEGTRRPVHQVLPCPRCGAENFVFPLSPWPRIGPPGDPLSGQRRTGPLRRLAPWKILLPLGLAITATLILIVFLLHGNGNPQGNPAPPSKDPAPHLAAARTALDQGNFRTALKELALAEAIQKPLPVPLLERRKLTQLRRQAALMADLVSVPLEELLQEANDLGPDEWQLVFADRYRGKAVLFDAEVCRTGAGNYEVYYDLRAGGQPVRIAVGDLDMIKELGKNMCLDQPTRLIMGGRLADIGPEPGDNWVVHFQPESGVLLTDRAILLVACPGYRKGLPGLKRTLNRQAEWLTILP